MAKSSQLLDTISRAGDDQCSSLADVEGNPDVWYERLNLWWKGWGLGTMCRRRITDGDWLRETSKRFGTEGDVSCLLCSMIGPGSKPRRHAVWRSICCLRGFTPSLKAERRICSIQAGQATSRQSHLSSVLPVSSASPSCTCYFCFSLEFCVSKMAITFKMTSLIGISASANHLAAVPPSLHWHWVGMFRLHSLIGARSCPFSSHHGPWTA